MRLCLFVCALVILFVQKNLWWKWRKDVLFGGVPALAFFRTFRICPRIRSIGRMLDPFLDVFKSLKCSFLFI